MVDDESGPPARAVQISTGDQEDCREVTHRQKTEQRTRPPALDEPVIISRFWKSSRDRKNSIVVSIKQWEGHTYLDCRVFGTNSEGQSVPTAKGITVGVARLEEFASAVSKVIITARQLGLIEDNAKANDGAKA